MRHIPDGVLRRLEDEPLAVPDRVIEHVDGCERCNARRAEIAHDSERAARHFFTPQPVPDLDVAWTQLRRELNRRETDAAGNSGRREALPRRTWLPRPSLRTGLMIGAIATVVAGTAAAATLTTIFSPTHVAPITVSQKDLRAIAAFTGLSQGQSLNGFATPRGSRKLRYGTISWSSGRAHRASSPAQAAADAGFPAPLPSHLPAGVGRVPQLIVQPRGSATFTFSSKAARLAGSSVTINAGPAVLAQYGGTNGTGAPTLAVATMRRPIAQSTGASLNQIEAFLLVQPSIPPQLAEEVRLLGDLKTILPVPVPAGAEVRSVQVDGWPGVLLMDSSDAASGVVWEDGHGLLHVVLGILDSRDVLNVANQLG